MGSLKIIRLATGAIVLLVGLVLLAGGAWLAFLGGSIYYLLSGCALSVIGCFTILHRGTAPLLYAVFLLLTLVWAIDEVGFEFWPLLPRVAGPAVLALFVALAFVSRARRAPLEKVGVMICSGLGLLSLTLLAASYLQADIQLDPVETRVPLAARAGDEIGWRNYGNTIGGTRYSPAGQISNANAGLLERAWTYQTGDSNALRPDIKVPMSFMATPIMADNRLIFCTPTGAVVALDPDSGRQLWRHDPMADAGSAQMLNCRGVSYHDSGERSSCSQRVLSTVVDGRLIALDASNGEQCEGFGVDGEISLADGLGRVEQGATYTTSPPTIVGDTAVLGAYVRDNYTTDEPSGVVRAFDVTSGRLLWAWDAGRPNDGGPLAEGETYTRGSPNAWSAMSADPDLGLVYVPTGNATPDHVGMHRTPLEERYASSIVALDIRTGAVRWHFQTTRHDLWDYDVPAQPVLFEFPDGATSVPAVAVPTKRGEIFVLDRRTGRSLTGVEDRPAQQGHVAGETYAPTQPYQVGFPTLSPRPLVESDMWGATPIDQLWCRIKFRDLDYEGDFTPPSLRGAIQYPGIFGMLNWGSVSIDERGGLMIANSSAIPQIVTLHPRSESQDPAANDNAHGAGQLAQEGTPYTLSMTPMVSPLGIPCPAPPWGHLTAIDLNKRETAWQRPLGTSADIAPFGIAVPGVFSIGGSTSTAGGVTFIGATLDDYLRAFDTKTGHELWRGRLPAGGQATPMTYVSGKTGKQYVVIAAGGHGFLGSTLGDYVVAFALPPPSANN